MPITHVVKDPDALTMTVTAEFPVPLRRLWDAYADPRTLERFWGPPTWPATFTRHDMAVGGRSEYTMRGPDGMTSSGYWEFLAVDAPHRFEVRDGFANDDGTPNTDMPGMTMVFSFEATATGSRVVIVTQFPSAEALQQLLEMGMEDGMRAAMGQIDDVLADLTSFAAGNGTISQVLSDTTVRISRVIRGPVAQVWRAYHEPELLRRWLVGPEGWTLSELEPPSEVGATFRFAWEPVPGGPFDGAPGFGLDGELLAEDPPYRSVRTERMSGMGPEGTRNELTMTAVEAGTLLSLLITYPSMEARDSALESGMLDGMESSYARLDAVLEDGV